MNFICQPCRDTDHDGCPARAAHDDPPGVHNQRRTLCPCQHAAPRPDTARPRA